MNTESLSIILMQISGKLFACMHVIMTVSTLYTATA